MDAVQINEWVTRYRLPASALDQRRRLDGVLALVLDSFLESALRSAGVSPEDEICIREIRAPLRLRLRAPDHALALSWAAAVADSIRQAIDHGDADWVVRYRSRSQALVEFARSTALGDLRRAWAWRQLGFGPLQERSDVAIAAERLVAVLQRQPEQIIPTLCAAAAGGWLGLLASRLDSKHWRLLAHAAAGFSFGEPGQAAGISRETVGRPPSNSVRAGVVERSLQWSAIAATAANQLQSQLTIEAIRFALATFALLEVEPGVLRRPADEVEELINVIASRLGTSADRSTRAAPGEAIPSTARRMTSSDRLAKAPGEESGRSPAGAEFDAPSQKEFSAEQKTAAAAKPSEPAAPERPVRPLRTEGSTPVGGLLFWIRVMDELRLPDELEMEEPFYRRPFRWVLHHLALTLARADPHDPAALAFAGLGPAAQPPSPGEAPLADTERICLASLRARLVEQVRGRLAAANPSAAERIRAMSEERLMDWICRRDARVVGDPGWIVLHFSLDDVSTEIRRAGLDLDPGYVPWLGVVLKYVYE